MQASHVKLDGSHVGYIVLRLKLMSLSECNLFTAILAVLTDNIGFKVHEDIKQRTLLADNCAP